MLIRGQSSYKVFFLQPFSFKSNSVESEFPIYSQYTSKVVVMMRL